MIPRADESLTQAPRKGSLRRLSRPIISAGMIFVAGTLTRIFHHAGTVLDGCRKGGAKQSAKNSSGQALSGTTAYADAVRFDRGRESETLPLPPNRTGGSPASGSPVGGFTSERIDKPSHGRRSERTALARQRRHWASGDGPCRGLDPGVPGARARCCAAACGPRSPRPRT